MIETREIVQFGNESFAKSFISFAVGKLNENLVAFFKKEIRNQKSSSGESFRKLSTVWEMKRLGYPSFKKSCFICFDIISLSKSEEMRLALWRAPVIQFLFHFVGISDS